MLQAKERGLAEAQKELKQNVSVISCREYLHVYTYCIFPGAWLQETELVQARDRELARAQQQLRSSEALVADLEKNHQQRDSELVQETKVTIVTVVHASSHSSLYIILCAYTVFQLVSDQSTWS